MPIKVPSADEPHLIKFMSLSDDAIERLIAALREGVPTLTRGDLAKQVATRTGIDLATITSTIRVLVSLYKTLDHQKVGIGEFAEEVRQALEKGGKAEFRPKSGDWNLFTDRLKALLSLDATLGITAKALTVSTEHEYYLCESRVLSEIRPVFGKDPEAIPPAAVINHILKLQCHDGDTMRDFFIAADSNSLKKLAQAIDRALKKDRTLRLLLDKAGVVSLQEPS